MAENALGGFIRARREAITPAMVGFPEGPRRRTPGLRRSELAQLAGISVEYLTRLERGRDRHPSVQVLGALADALGLTPDERVHLYRLVKVGNGQQCQQAADAPPPVRATMRALLDRLEPTPALLVDARDDVLAYTAGFWRLAGPTGLLDGERPNLARFVFEDPRARTVFADWEQVADERAAALRAAADLGDLAAGTLADELAITVGNEFGRRYAAAAALPDWTGVQRWRHPTVGTLNLAFESLLLPGVEEEQRLVAFLPADEETAAALAALAASGGEDDAPASVQWAGAGGV